MSEASEAHATGDVGETTVEGVWIIEEGEGWREWIREMREGGGEMV